MIHTMLTGSGRVFCGAIGDFSAYSETGCIKLFLENIVTVMFSEKLCSPLSSRIFLLNYYNSMGKFLCAVTVLYQLVHWSFFLIEVLFYCLS